jgi:hypothetical protein
VQGPVGTRCFNEQMGWADPPDHLLMHATAVTAAGVPTRPNAIDEIVAPPHEQHVQGGGFTEVAIAAASLLVIARYHVIATDRRRGFRRS